MKAQLACVLLFSFIPQLLAWDADDLSLFDVVEDVNKNFYELLEISQDASSSEIRKAYRRLSLQLHPDKNKEPDAEHQFRKLVAVYEILKDENLRSKYNDVLENGLPDWRQPVYYYRKVKKMGLVDLALFLSVVLTLGHYLVMWTAYYERKYELEEVFKPKKKKDKKGKRGKMADEEEEEGMELPEELVHLLVKPTYKDVLPVLLVKHTIRLFTHHLPATIVALVASLRKKKEEDGEEEDDVEDTHRQRPARTTGPLVHQLAEDSQAINYTRTSPATKDDHDVVETSVKKSGQQWQDGELNLLVKAIIKFPGGTSERWEKIAKMVGRSTKDVMDMVKKFKSTQVMTEMNAKVVGRKGASHMTLNHVQTSTVDPADRTLGPEGGGGGSSGVGGGGGGGGGGDGEGGGGGGGGGDGGGGGGGGVKKEVSDSSLLQLHQPSLSSSSSSPPSSSSSSSSSSQWSQQQQKCLESAMQQVDRTLPDRWDRIASLVEGKSKSDCLQRVKYLSNLVKKKKTETTTNSTTNPTNPTTNPTNNPSNNPSNNIDKNSTNTNTNKNNNSKQR